MIQMKTGKQKNSIYRMLAMTSLKHALIFSQNTMELFTSTLQRGIRKIAKISLSLYLKKQGMSHLNNLIELWKS